MRLRKNIYAVCEIGPNYVFHVLALARVSFDSDYADRYAHSMPAADKHRLSNMNDMLFFRNGSAGKLVFPVILFPAYLNLDSQSKMDTYFSLLLQGLYSGNYNSFLKEYSVPLKKMTLWTFHGDLARYFMGISKYRHKISQISEIYRHNLGAYLRDVWPVEKLDIERVASVINRHFSRRDTIGKWEIISRRKFKFPNYQIVLCSAIKNGANANSLGYERTVFFSQGDIAMTLDFISHETGTHILIDETRNLYAGRRFNPGDIYSAYECLCKFYNQFIIEHKPSYSMSVFNEESYLPIFKELYSITPRPSPGKMLVAAITKVQKLSNTK